MLVEVVDVLLQVFNCQFFILLEDTRVSDNIVQSTLVPVQDACHPLWSSDCYALCPESVFGINHLDR